MGLLDLSLKASVFALMNRGEKTDVGCVCVCVLPFKLKIQINITDVKKKKVQDKMFHSAHFLLKQDDLSLWS